MEHRAYELGQASHMKEDFVLETKAIPLLLSKKKTGKYDSPSINESYGRRTKTETSPRGITDRDQKGRQVGALATKNLSMKTQWADDETCARETMSKSRTTQASPARERGEEKMEEKRRIQPVSLNL